MREFDSLVGENKDAFDVWGGNVGDINGLALVESRILSRLRERRHEKRSAKQDIFDVLYYQK